MEDKTDVKTAILSAMLPLAASFYLTCVTIAYNVRVNRADRTDCIPNRSRKTEKWMRRLILCAASAIFGRQIFVTVEISRGFYDDSICSVFRRINNTTYGIIIFLIYFALWVRQRIFYDCTLSTHISNTFTRTLSASVIVVMVTGTLGGVLLYVTTREYKSSEHGCTLNYTTIPEFVPGVYFISCVVTFQTLLLFLFSYPIIKHNAGKVGSNSPSKGTLNVLRRIVTVTAIDILLDLGGAITSRKLIYALPSIYHFLIYDVMLVKSCICVICSFCDWRRRLMLPSPCWSREMLVSATT